MNYQDALDAGCCRVGLDWFIESAGLDPAGNYTVEEIITTARKTGLLGLVACYAPGIPWQEREQMTREVGGSIGYIACCALDIPWQERERMAREAGWLGSVVCCARNIPFQERERMAQELDDRCLRYVRMTYGKQ